MTPGTLIRVNRTVGRSFRMGRVPGRVVAVDGDTVTYEVPCIGADGRLTRQTCRLSECVAVEDDEIRREFAGKEALL